MSRLRSTWQSSFHFRQFCLHFVEVRQCARVGVALGILNHAAAIHDKHRALWHAAHSKISFRKKRIVGNVVGLRHFVLVIAQQRRGDLFLFRPCFLGKRIVTADSINIRVERAIRCEVQAHTAHFHRAGTGKSHWEKKQERVFLAEVVAQFYLLRTVLGLGHQGEVRCFRSNREWHREFQYKIDIWRVNLSCRAKSRHFLLFEFSVMELFWWLFLIVLFAVGLIGTVLPIFPGAVVILAGAVIHRMMVGAEKSVGWKTIVILGALTLASYALDFLGSYFGAKYFGATKWGTIGAIIGALVGLFFGIIGLFVG